MRLVPSDGLYPRRPEKHFAADAARQAGLQVAPVDHDALVETGDAERDTGPADGNGDGNDGNRGQLPAHVQRRLPRSMLCEPGGPYSL
jgi:hypothetical protein